MAAQGPIPPEACPADLDLFSVASPMPTHEDATAYGPQPWTDSGAQSSLLEVSAPLFTTAALTIAAAAPAAPSAFLATKYSSSGIALQWNDNSGDETGFKIERKTGSGSWSRQRTPWATRTTSPTGGASPGEPG